MCRADVAFFSLLFNCFQYTISIYEIVSSSSANNGGDYSYNTIDIHV